MKRSCRAFLFEGETWESPELSTFAREFLPKETEIVHFVNADAIAAGRSALKPEIVAVAAARITGGRLVGV